MFLSVAKCLFALFLKTFAKIHFNYSYSSNNFFRAILCLKTINVDNIFLRIVFAACAILINLHHRLQNIFFPICCHEATNNLTFGITFNSFQTFILHTMVFYYWTPVFWFCFWLNLCKWFPRFISFWSSRFRFHILDEIWCHDDGSKINIAPLTHTSIAKLSIDITPPGKNILLFVENLICTLREQHSSFLSTACTSARTSSVENSSNLQGKRFLLS